MSDQPLPHDLAAEKALLGAMLSDRARIDTAAMILRGDEFHSPRHAEIFTALIGLHASGQPADPVTVADQMRANGVDDPNLLADLTAMQIDTPSTRNAGRYARIVADKYRLRCLWAAGTEIATKAREGGDVAALSDWAEQTIYGVTDRARATSHAVHLGESLHGWLDHVHNRQGGPVGIPTGWKELDKIIAGLRPGQLIVVAARPGMGKSQFLANLVLHTTAYNHPTLFVSAEMALVELQDRFVASECRIPLQAIRMGQLQEGDYARLSQSMADFLQKPLWIHESPSATIMSIRSEARRVASKAGRIGVIAVDYLQLVKPAGRPENRQNEVAQVARGLKELAIELQVPVVAAAQLNRQTEIRTERRPSLGDLRESGEVENAADVVMFLYREDYYNKESPEAGTCEVIVEKHRNGPRDKTKLAWRPEYGRLDSLAWTGV